MSGVSIVGVGTTPVDKHWESSMRELGVRAINDALRDAGVSREAVDSLYVGNMLSGKVVDQENVGALIADFADLGHVPATKVEAACASGGAALQAGVKGVLSGLEDLTVVLGVEKLTDVCKCDVNEGLAYAADQEFETFHGATFVSLNAMATRLYMQEFDVDHEDLMHFSVNAHRNAANNPDAMFQSEIDVETAMNSVEIADPLKLFDVTPICDGAAAVVLAPSDRADEYCETPVEVSGVGNAVDSIGLHDREEFVEMAATLEAADQAYDMASMTPGDVDVIELHDAFTVMSAMGLEDMGFVEKGEAAKAAREGRITVDGDLPATTMGGLKARGHPVGATGVYQAVEIVEQLRGEAGANQVPDAETGIAQNIGGTGSNVTVTILERGD
ncbi:MAG TPA: thiolase domain-containing protein [Natrialbaceae archaeon]|nr:thiolase domain-containing protein [Natrialbaceae archaeon]